MSRAALERADIIWHLSVSYQSLVEAGAPGDLLQGVAYWLRRATREGLTEADLEHALEATAEGKVSPMARKDAP